ncbi:MAG: metallophosphoesterase family protein [Eubacteriales bacterium]|jgi:exonuclease SbcD
MVRILHTGDLHLESPFRGIRDSLKARQRRAELDGCLLEMIDYAVENQVDLFLIAGDLFDGALTDIRVFRQWMERMEQAAQVRFFIAPGNHDYYHARSLYALEALPANVKVFTGPMERVELPQLGVDVYGAAFCRPHEGPLLRGFRAQPGRTSIMVLHGDTAPGSEYGPITSEDIRESGLDYLALGHVHSFSGLQRQGGTTWAYSGVPMGRGFDEAGEKGFVEVTVEPGRVQGGLVPLEGRQYRVEELDVTGMTLPQEVLRTLRGCIAQVGSQHLLRVRLVGRAGAGVVDLPLLQAGAGEDCYYLELADDTRPAEDMEALARERSLRGVFTRMLLQKVQQASTPEEARLASLALELGLDNLRQEVRG